MKSTINYYYNLFPDNIVRQEKFFYFWIGEEKYYFVPFNNNHEQVLKIYRSLIEQKLKVNHIILNKDSNLVTLYKNEEYVLFRVNCLENEVVDLTNFFDIKVNEIPVDWGKVWSDKIDYFSYQVSQRALHKDNILNSFSYYVGMGENAIQYYNLLKKENARVSIQHKRVYASNYEINYYNSLNMLYDYNVRDLAEYIKFAFFQDKLNVDKVINYINKLQIDSVMMNLLFDRLLFPTYYFDHYEKLVNDEEEETELIHIIRNANNYEKFLKDFYNYYALSHNLIKIDWLI